MEVEVDSEETPTTQVVENIQAPKVTVGFERNVSVRPYESMKASVFIQADVPLGYTPEQLEAGLRDAFFQAKAQVLEQLGLEFEINEHGVVMELITKAFGPVEKVEEDANNNRAAGPVGTNGQSLVCGNDPGHKMWDNRAKKASGEYKPSAPDGKCSVCDYKAWPAKTR